VILEVSNIAINIVITNPIKQQHTQLLRLCMCRGTE
jgi:hypothetical protein